VQRVDLEIEDIAFGGAGVGRLNGKTIFVPLTIDGERVTARVVREKKQFAEAELEEVVDASPRRAQPACPYFGRCGGCSYQHISYEHQLELKHRQVEQILRRIGGIAHPPMQPIIPSPKPYGYRNRVTVHAEDGVIGYYRRNAHRLIDVACCPIADPTVNRALAELRSRNPRNGHYTLRAHEGPRVFAQTNDEVAEAMALLVTQLLSDGDELLIDAYCGAGFFAKRLIDRFDRVLGIEWDRHAIAAAQRTAIAKETYIAGDVDEEFAAQMARCDPARTTVIMDPPAAGLGVRTRRALLDRPPHTIVYVSCDPATLARDIRELRQQFELLSATPLDMFPQTAEIECVAHLKAKPDA